MLLIKIVALYAIALITLAVGTLGVILTYKNHPSLVIPIISIAFFGSFLCLFFSSITLHNYLREDRTYREQCGQNESCC